MRVGLVTKPDRQMTGLLRYALSVHNALRAQGMDVALIHPRSPIPDRMARLARAANLDSSAFFASYPLRVHLEGVSVCHLASQTLATLLLFQRLPPTVVTVHDIIPHLVRHSKALSTYREPIHRLFDRIALWSLRRADALIAISQFTKQTLVDTLGYPAERIHVVYRAVDKDVFRPLAVLSAFRGKHGLDEDCRHVLYVGSEDPRKNVDSLIRAFSLVRRQIPSAKLIKAGSAHYQAQRQKLLGLVAELELTECVRFLDHVPEEDLALLYNAADVFVLPSFYEGFGLPALEAMSCGTPVIASDRASLPEVVGKGGTLVDPDDVQELARRIVALLTEPDRHAQASQAAQEQATRFSMERQASETMAVYQEVA